MHATAHNAEPDAEPAAADPGLALREVVAILRVELVELGRCADGLQTAIGTIVERAAARLSHDDLIRLQAADVLSQRLDRLAGLAGALEAQIPPGWTLDPASARDAASALVRLGGKTAIGAPAHDDGDFELF